MTKQEEKDLIKQLIDHVVVECDPVDVEAQYDEWFDECNRESVEACSIVSHMRPSRLQRELSPTDYRCGCADFSGTNDDWVEVGCPAELYELKEVEAAREEFLDTFENDLVLLERELEAIEETLDEGELVPQAESILKDDKQDHTGQIKELEAQIKLIKNYTF